MEKYVSSFDGTKIHYVIHRGKISFTLVFLHGVGGNWTCWKKELKYFQNKGYSTLALDLRGHGRSDTPFSFSKYKFPNFSRDLYHVLKREKINRFSLLGHSLGGGIAVTYCGVYKQPYPSSVIFVETPVNYPFKHTQLLNMSPYVTHLLRYIARNKKLRERHLQHFCDFDLSEEGLARNFHTAQHLLHLTPIVSLVKTLDNVERYIFKNQKKINQHFRTLSVPALIITADGDKTVPPPYSEKIKELNQRAVLKKIKGCSHQVIIEKPRLINKIIYDFLKNSGT